MISDLTDVRPLQPEKASRPMYVTLLGMVMDVRPLQSQYLQVVLYQRFAC